MKNIQWCNRTMRGSTGNARLGVLGRLLWGGDVWLRLGDRSSPRKDQGKKSSRLKESKYSNLGTLRNSEKASVAGTQSTKNTRGVGNEVREEDRRQICRRPYVGGHRETSALSFSIAERGPCLKPGSNTIWFILLNINFHCYAGTKLTVLATE